MISRSYPPANIHMHACCTGLPSVQIFVVHVRVWNQWFLLPLVLFLLTKESENNSRAWKEKRGGSLFCIFFSFDLLLFPKKTKGKRMQNGGATSFPHPPAIGPTGWVLGGQFGLQDKVGCIILLCHQQRFRIYPEERSGHYRTKNLVSRGRFTPEEQTPGALQWKAIICWLQVSHSY